MATKKMSETVKLQFSEELTNCLTHGLMSFICLCILPLISVYTYANFGTLRAFGVSVSIICLFLMFTVSALYHAMPYNTSHKLVFRRLDHICIYFAIAGSYTPIVLSLIGGWLGYLFLILEWGAVICGVLLKSISKKSYPKLSMVIYMMMGWAAVLILPSLISNARIPFIVFIVLGGLMYTVGAFFYAHPQKKFFHSIWHICINVASLFHFIAIVLLM